MSLMNILLGIESRKSSPKPAFNDSYKWVNRVYCLTVLVCKLDVEDKIGCPTCGNCLSIFYFISQ